MRINNTKNTTFRITVSSCNVDTMYVLMPEVKLLNYEPKDVKLAGIPGNGAFVYPADVGKYF